MHLVAKAVIIAALFNPARSCGTGFEPEPDGSSGEAGAAGSGETGGSANGGQAGVSGGSAGGDAAGQAGAGGATPAPGGGGAAGDPTSGAAGVSAGTGGSGGSEPVPSAPTFAEVKALISTCAAAPCHGGSGSNSDLRDDAGLHERLLLPNAKAADPKCQSMPLVTPGDPDQSLLLSKLSDSPVCGERMPYACDYSGTCLEPAAIETIKSWIIAGARAD